MTGEAAGLAMGLTELGSNSATAIEDMVAYAQETQHEKILRGQSVLDTVGCRVYWTQARFKPYLNKADVKTRRKFQLFKSEIFFYFYPCVQY